MPKAYLYLYPLPDNPVKDWLTWSNSELELSIIDASKKIAGLIGINKAGDLQYICMPIFIPSALGNATVIIDNSNDWKSEPSFVYVDATDFEFISVIEIYSKILDEICPEEHLPSKFVKGTAWKTALVELGLVAFPMVAPIFFGMHSVKASIYDTDFEDKLGLLSTKHLQQS
jgi:hypothetical protein